MRRDQPAAIERDATPAPPGPPIAIRPTEYVPARRSSWGDVPAAACTGQPEDASNRAKPPAWPNLGHDSTLRASQKSSASGLLVVWAGELRPYWLPPSGLQAEVMTARSAPGPAGGTAATQQRPGEPAVPRAVSATPGNRACCCPAKAVVRIVMPPSPARPHPTDLLLCAHHYRVSRRALADAEAAICELPGIPYATTS